MTHSFFGFFAFCPTSFTLIHTPQMSDVVFDFSDHRGVKQIRLAQTQTTLHLNNNQLTAISADVGRATQLEAVWVRQCTRHAASSD